jgi:hypothetical protein
MPAKLLHQLPAPHSASLKHVALHAPVTVLQKGPAWPAPQLASFAHTPHAPVA